LGLAVLQELDILNQVVWAQVVLIQLLLVKLLLKAAAVEIGLDLQIMEQGVDLVVVDQILTVLTLVERHPKVQHQELQQHLLDMVVMVDQEMEHQKFVLEEEEVQVVSVLLDQQDTVAQEYKYHQHSKIQNQQWVLLVHQVLIGSLEVAEVEVIQVILQVLVVVLVVLTLAVEVENLDQIATLHQLVAKTLVEEVEAEGLIQHQQEEVVLVVPASSSLHILHK